MSYKHETKTPELISIVINWAGRRLRLRPEQLRIFNFWRETGPGVDHINIKIETDYEVNEKAPLFESYQYPPPPAGELLGELIDGRFLVTDGDGGMEAVPRDYFPPKNHFPGYQGQHVIEVDLSEFPGYQGQYVIEVDLSERPFVVTKPKLVKANDFVWGPAGGWAAPNLPATSNQDAGGITGPGWQDDKDATE